MTLNFNLIRKTKLTKVFKLFLEKRFIKFKLKAVTCIIKSNKYKKFYVKSNRKIKIQRARRKMHRKKRRLPKWLIKKRRLRRKTFRVSKLLSVKKKKWRRRRRFRKNKFYDKDYIDKMNKAGYKKGWERGIIYKLREDYFNKNNLNIFKKKKKLSFLRKKRFFMKRKNSFYLRISQFYAIVSAKRMILQLKKKFSSSKMWLSRNRRFSIYMPEAKKKKRRKKKKSNWWKLRLLNRKISLYYGFTNLKKFRYIFNFYEKGMNFDIKSICRLELMLNMVMLSLSFVDNIMMSNSFVRIMGVIVNGKAVNYPYRVIKKGSMISFDRSKFKRLYSMIKNKFKRDKTYVLRTFKKYEVNARKWKQSEKNLFKMTYRDVVHFRDNKKRGTAWYLKALRIAKKKLAKARAILKRLEDIRERITASDIRFFYGTKQDKYYYFYYRKKFDGRGLLKKVGIIKSVPKYIEANFKILHFIIWANPHNSQIAKLYKKNHNLHGWNFSTQIENN